MRPFACAFPCHRIACFRGRTAAFTCSIPPKRHSHYHQSNNIVLYEAKMLAKETYYHEISMFDSPESNVPKQPKDGKVGVDHKAIYIGQKSNWRYPWKKISNVVFEGRDSLTITCVDGKSVECIDNTEDNFSSFRELVLKLWHKKQGKAAKAEEEERESRPLVKKRKTYGKTGRSYAKPRMSMTMMSRTDFSSDEEEDTTFGKTKPTLKEETMKEMPADEEEEEEEENEFNDGESPPGFDNSDEEDNDDDHETPAVKPNRVSGTIKRGRIQKRILDDDSDDELFHDTAALTTPASKRLVSPANALDYEQDDDEENQEPPNKQPDSMDKGNQSIKNYFTVFGAGNKPSATTKAPTTTISTILKSPKRKSSPFAKSPLPSKSPVKVPLKQDNSEWLSKLPSTAPSVQSRSRLFGKKPTNVLDEDDIESDSSAPPLSREVKAGIYGHGDTGEGNKETVEKDASTFDSPPRDSVLHPTSGVDRKRFRVKNTPAKRSSADEALSYPSTPKRMRMHRYNPLHSSIKVTAPDTILKPKSPWTGLRNLGNTCYINSSLQMLFTVPTFVSSLAGKGKDLSKSLVSVSNDVKDTSAIRAANPSIVKMAIDAVTDKFQGYQQRDAHEFLSDLVDRVHDELEEEQKEKGIETTDTTPLFPTDEYFRMNVQVCLTCDSCGYARYVYSMHCIPFDAILLIFFSNFLWPHSFPTFSFTNTATRRKCIVTCQST